MTTIDPIVLTDMYFYLPVDTLPLMQTFTQLTDVVAN
jgi:hypothetical protein